MKFNWISKLFSILSLAVVSLLTPVVTLASTLAVSPSMNYSNTLNKGCTYPIKVLLDTQNIETVGTDAVLKYDPNKFELSLSSIIRGNLYSIYPGTTIDSINGIIYVSGIANTSFRGNGTFAIVNLTVKPTAPTGPTSLKFDFDPANPGKTDDSNVVETLTIQDSLTSVTDGSYTIANGECPASGPDTTAPSCRQIASGVDPSGKKYVEIVFRDAGSGLNYISPVLVNNATLDTPTVITGTNDKIIVKATKINQSSPSQVEFRVFDVAGNSFYCR